MEAGDIGGWQMKLEDLLPSLRFASSEQVTPIAQPGQKKGLWQRWIDALTGNREPQIFHRRDGQGHSYLEVYDPTTSKTHRFETTQEVRIWLERRYYNS
jgi:hypothetical protein